METNGNPHEWLVGETVDYFLPSHGCRGREGERRAAIVVYAWQGEGPLVNLAVYVDGANDGYDSGPVVWVTSVKPGNGEPGTWRIRGQTLTAEVGSTDA